MRLRVLAGALLSMTLVAAPAASADHPAPGGGTPGTAKNFKLVGHEPLFGRGMNAALTIFDHYVYVGNRTDGSSQCGAGDPRGPGANCLHQHPGVLIVDIKDPSHPQTVGEIGAPLEGNVGITSRELRVWPDRKLLMVMNFRCSAQLHACPPGTDADFPFDIKFYDLSDPVHPRLLSSYVPTSQAGRAVKPHEMFLWVDPHNPARALLWLSTPTTSADPAVPNLMIVDISAVPGGGAVREVAEGNWNPLYPGAADPANYDNNLITHSMTPAPDGRVTYLAQEAGHFLALDTSSVVDAQPSAGVISLNDKLQTQPADRPIWGNPVPGCEKACPNSHSALPVPGRPLAFTTDEVYGTFTDPSFGCPWGWARLIDVADPAHPRIIDEYRIAQNLDSFCGSPADDPATEQFNSYTSHNPTLLRDLAFVTWHSGGLQAIRIDRGLRQAGWFSPRPLDTVANEDPALSAGPNKVVMWSYPIIKDGLIYVIDIRNGLYVLRYTGDRQRAVRRISFLEGNSNLGDAPRLASRSWDDD